MKPLAEQYSSFTIQTSPQRFSITSGDYFTNRSFEFCQSEFKMSSSLASPTNVSFIPVKVVNDMLNTDWELWLMSFLLFESKTGSRQEGVGINLFFYFSNYLFSICLTGIRHFLSGSLGFVGTKKNKNLKNSKRQTVALLETCPWFICIAITKPFFTHNLNYHNHSFYNSSHFPDFSPSRL